MLVGHHQLEIQLYELTNIASPSTTTADFLIGEIFTGESSGAIWSLASSDTLAMPTTPFADNTEFETDADSILDFSESNPFGEVT